ncbi:dihydrofolate reductase family protein [Micromonospora sp. NPDC047620]|uniref:dihydrofolate reductase family protein n=1 Tax=Micromonospora sp. NPDC047620 TaxID=3364251 RepID=UPI00371B821B
MRQRKLVYYVASTLDGYIAGPQGQYDSFLHEGDHMAALAAEFPETIPVHMRDHFGLVGVPHRRFDTVVMGRGTYEPTLSVGTTSSYPHLRQYVVSRSLTVDDPTVKVVAQDPVGLIRRLKQDDGADIWLCGGGHLAGHLLAEIDTLIIKRHPIVAGAGIPLLAGNYQPTRFAPTSAREFDSGVTLLTYTAQT